jgi:hypothetical protein
MVSASVLADSTAAVSRFEPETSWTSITVAARCGAATVRCGRASATTRTPAASSSRSAGTWRRQPGSRGTRFGISAGLANAAASRRRRRWIAL